MPGKSGWNLYAKRSQPGFSLGREYESQSLSRPSIWDVSISCEALGQAQEAVSYAATDHTVAQLDPRSVYYYSCSVAKRHERGALVDRGANGGILGNDVVVLVKHIQCLDVTGIDNHELSQLPLVDAASKPYPNTDLLSV